MIEVRRDRNNVRRVYALKDFTDNELIASAPVLYFTIQSWDTIKQRGEWMYSYVWDDERDVLALGSVTLCRHNTENPNAYFRKNLENETLELVAKPDGIKAGEEISVHWEMVRQ